MLAGKDTDDESSVENEIGEIEFTQAEQGNDPIVSIATGRNHVLALDTAGRVYAWGDNLKGQLGVGKKKGKEEYRKP